MTLAKIRVHCIHCILKFNKKFWLKPDNDMNTELGKNAKADFKKDFF